MDQSSDQSPHIDTAATSYYRPEFGTLDDGMHINAATFGDDSCFRTLDFGLLDDMDIPIFTTPNNAAGHPSAPRSNPKSNTNSHSPNKSPTKNNSSTNNPAANTIKSSTKIISPTNTTPNSNTDAQSAFKSSTVVISPNKSNPIPDINSLPTNSNSQPLIQSPPRIQSPPNTNPNPQTPTPNTNPNTNPNSQPLIQSPPQIQSPPNTKPQSPNQSSINDDLPEDLQVNIDLDGVAALGKKEKRCADVLKGFLRSRLGFLVYSGQGLYGDTPFGIPSVEIVQTLTRGKLDISVIRWVSVYINQLKKNKSCVIFDADAIKQPDIDRDRDGVKNHIKDFCLKHAGKKYFLAPFLHRTA